MKTKLLFSLLLITLSGCTTWSANYLDSTPVPEEKLDPEFSKYLSATDETAKIIIMRDYGPGAALFDMNFFINGERVARIDYKQSLTLHMKPEEYQLGINFGWMQSAEEEPVKEQPLEVMAGETYIYRIRAIVPKGVVLERTL